MNELLGINPAQGGAVAIVTIVVLFIILGRLVPRSVLEDVRKDRDDRLQALVGERDAWREAYRESEAARMESQSQVGELLELSRTADHVLRAIRGEVHGDAMDSTGAAPPS
ncbi:hypothetical protein [Streptomyces sp. NPDC018584]|uniref:hypothetical protein n=1 Tax=unclassified Streptomyces TaxID=2593676 RepID=UPI0037B398EA